MGLWQPFFSPNTGTRSRGGAGWKGVTPSCSAVCYVLYAPFQRVNFYDVFSTVATWLFTEHCTCHLPHVAFDFGGSSKGQGAGVAVEGWQATGYRLPSAGGVLIAPVNSWPHAHPHTYTRTHTHSPTYTHTTFTHTHLHADTPNNYMCAMERTLWHEHELHHLPTVHCGCCQSWQRQGGGRADWLAGVQGWTIKLRAIGCYLWQTVDCIFNCFGANLCVLTGLQSVRAEQTFYCIIAVFGFQVIWLQLPQSNKAIKNAVSNLQAINSSLRNQWAGLPEN